MSRTAAPAAETASARERLFFALWPDEASRAALAALAREALPGRGKLVAPENLHITLVFLGGADPQQRACAERAAGAAAAPAFTLRLERLGGFRRAGVLWSAPCETPAPLHTLVDGLNRGLAPCGFEPETRPYHAHVTLARKLERRVRERPHPPIEWPVQAFHLVQSHLHAQGARYRILRSWPLAGPA